MVRREGGTGERQMGQRDVGGRVLEMQGERLDERVGDEGGELRDDIELAGVEKEGTAEIEAEDVGGGGSRGVLKAACSDFERLERSRVPQRPCNGFLKTADVL